MRIRRTAMAAVLALGVSLLGVPGTAAAAEDAVTLSTTFNDPIGTSSRMNAIRDQLISLIKRTPPGEEIRGTVFLFTDDAVRNALLEAKKNGVKVMVILDHQSDNTAEGGEFEHLRDGMDPVNHPELGLGGAVFSEGSWVMTCPATRACIGDRDLNGDDDGGVPINHNKFFLFSKVGSTPNVVFQTSANLTGTKNVTYYNNAVTIPDAKLYASYAGYFQDLRTMGKTWNGNDNYYRTEDVGAYKTYFFPRHETGGTYKTDPDTDTVVSLLSNVSCPKQGPKTQVRVAMYAFTRPQVADSLTRLKSEGCQVEVVQHDEVDPETKGKTLGDAVREKLGAPGAIDHFATCFGHADNADGTTRRVGVHSKYLLVEGTYRDVAGSKVVFTGSHNYTFPNLRSNDETLLKISNSAVHDAFKANFETVKASRICTG
ncbi:hypothetical protein F4556_004952 [Kitasatospora gansuensis]|uniref:phospholipase D n=1 Tax=Kitasatospora gansuensis TaxID=258050 RepID=A0A7W7SG15_9ACTN|nr:phospholipase D-like domain-containing protein [Kitasatospora gansuensis]MBB4949417.1 hypothetical protein [Kitasatospora gansuensis]